jgi:FlgD Ig-like domain
MPPHGQNGLMRLEATAPVRVSLVDGADGFLSTVAANEVTWGEVSLWGSTPQIAVECRGEQSSFTVDLAEVPSAPTSVVGRTPPGTRSQLFVAGQAGEWVLDLQLNQGAVRVRRDWGGPTRDFASSGTWELGQLSGGTRLIVEGLDGPPAHWTARLHVLPPRVISLRFGVPVIRSGIVATARYTLSGDAAVTASILDLRGRVIRELATSLPIGAGEHSFAWDGLDAAGRPVAHGRYTLRVHPAGGEPSSATVDVDNLKPTVRFPSGLRSRSTRGISVRVVDQLSGLRQATVLIDGRVVGRTSRLRPPVFTYRPALFGWRRGRHRVEVRAVDRVGNRTRVSRIFIVRD